MNFNELLSRALTRAGNQTKLAKELKTSRQNVSHWVSGRCKPTLDMYYKILEYVGEK